METLKKLDKQALVIIIAELKPILNELNWKLIKAERALYLHQSSKAALTEKLQANLQRAEETRLALRVFSEGHPLRHQCEDDLYKTEIRICRLENKLKKFSPLKLIQLEVKKLVLSEEIRYYENLVKEAEALLNPVVVLRRVMDTPDGEVRRNAVPDEEKIFILQPKREAMDVGELSSFCG